MMSSVFSTCYSQCDCGERGPRGLTTQHRTGTLSQPHPFWTLPQWANMSLGDISTASVASPRNVRRKKQTYPQPKPLGIFSNQLSQVTPPLSPRTAHTKPHQVFQERYQITEEMQTEAQLWQKEKSWLMYTDRWLLSTSCSRVKEMGTK